MDEEKISWTTARGEVVVRSFCSPDRISSLSFRKEHTRYPRYRPLVSHKEDLMQAAMQPDANVTLAHTRDGRIVGFAILQYPSPEDRWARVGDRTMMEVSVLEVGRPWRDLGISKELLRLLVNHPLKEDRIFYMIGYSWTWDCDGKGISASAYRNLLMGLFSAFGFRTYQTNEPNVMLRPENLFMARVGLRIPPETQKRFKLVRFNLDRYV